MRNYILVPVLYFISLLILVSIYLIITI